MTRLKQLSKYFRDQPHTYGYVIVAAMIIVLAIYGLNQFAIKLSPSVDNSTLKATLIFRATDHTVSDAILPNNFFDSTIPDYSGNDDQLELLVPDSNGNISAFPRIQGEINYKWKWLQFRCRAVHRQELEAKRIFTHLGS